MPDLAKLYHARRGIEELCKTARQGLCLEQFRGRSERLVQQELKAHCTLIALTRRFAHHSEEAWRGEPDGHGRPGRQVNFQHSLCTVARHLEGLFLQHAQLPGKTVQRILDGIGRSRPRRRPGRAHARRSRKPASRWRNRKATATPA